MDSKALIPWRGKTRPYPVFGCILHLNERRLIQTICWWHASHGIEAVYLIDGAGRDIFSLQLQPGHILRRIRRIRRPNLGTRRRAPIVQVGVQVEKRRRLVEEVVHSALEQICYAAGWGRVRDGEVVGDAREHGEQRRVLACYAGGVEEGGVCADLHGDAVCGVVGAGVVLRATADGDVGER